MSDGTMEERLGKIEEWVFAVRKRGWNDQRIEKEMRGKGYSNLFIQKTLEEFPSNSAWKKYLIPTIVSIFAIAVIVIVFLNFSVFYTKSCSNDLCFSELANQCKPVKMEKNIAGSMYTFTEKACILTKRVEKMNETEPAQMVSFLESRSMDCSYEPGNFDNNLITTVSLGMENCSGKLVDSIKDLMTSS